ncbi:YSC84-related protein [Pandoraea thiooxydans]|nr:YSC84-related protein [Pandoraea thiooxydans]
MESVMQKKRNLMVKLAISLYVVGTVLGGCTTTGMTGVASTDKVQQIDASMQTTLNRLYSTMPSSRELVGKARGVLVFPSVLAAGFIIGGEYGEGALRVGNRTVGYYNTVTGSYGLQIGAQSKAIIFLFMTQDALQKFRDSQGWTVGADASVAVIKAGANGDIDVNTATEPVDVIVMTNQGLMANLSIEGTKITKLKVQ